MLIIRYTLSPRKARSIRHRKGISSEKVRTSLKNRGKPVPYPTFHAYETGARPISHEILKQWCKALGCRQRDILA